MNQCRVFVYRLHFFKDVSKYSSIAKTYNVRYQYNNYYLCVDYLHSLKKDLSFETSCFLQRIL